jgi:hypothetical protein
MVDSIFFLSLSSYSLVWRGPHCTVHLHGSKHRYFFGTRISPTVGCHITSNIQVAVQNFRVQLTWLEKEQYITGILVVLNSLFVEIHARQPDSSDLSSDIIVTSFPRRKKKGYRPNLTFNAIDNFTAHGPPAGPPVPLNSTHLTGRGHFCKWEFYRNQESHTRK